MIKIVIFTHGNLGAALRETAESIVGPHEDIHIISVRGNDSLSAVSEKLKELLTKIQDNDGAIVLADMVGGTPCNTSLMLAKEYKVEIITGLNLYMLISAVMNREHMVLTDLAQKVLGDAQKNIMDAKKALINRMK